MNSGIWLWDEIGRTPRAGHFTPYLVPYCDTTVVRNLEGRANTAAVVFVCSTRTIPNLYA